MLTLTNPGFIKVITLDVVRQTIKRAETTRMFCRTQLALDCKAFVFMDDNGLIDRIELWGGDEAQHIEFLVSLDQELNNVYQKNEVNILLTQ